MEARPHRLKAVIALFATIRGYMFSISAASNYIELGERIEAPFTTYRRGSCFGSDPPGQVLPCFAVCGCCNLWVVHGYSLVPEPVRKECQEMALRRGTGFVLMVVVASARMSEGGPARVCARARLIVPACAGAGGWSRGGARVGGLPLQVKRSTRVSPMRIQILEWISVVLSLDCLRTWVGRICPSSRQRSDDYRISFAVQSSG